MHGSPALRIVIAYESYAAGLHGLATAVRLASQFESDFSIDQDLWNFSALADPDLHRHAVATAAGADMLIVSGQRIPGEVMTWVESWTESKANEPGALVLLASGTDSTDPTIVNRLERLARDVGIDFFCKPAASRLSESDSNCTPWGFAPNVDCDMGAADRPGHLSGQPCEVAR